MGKVAAGKVSGVTFLSRGRELFPPVCEQVDGMGVGVGGPHLSGLRWPLPIFPEGQAGCIEPGP